jgi:hypothetical protein
MTQEEKNYVLEYVSSLFQRINTAKEQIRQQNYGQALDTLSVAYPIFDINVDTHHRIVPPEQTPPQDDVPF